MGMRLAGVNEELHLPRSTPPITASSSINVKLSCAIILAIGHTVQHSELPEASYSL